MGTSLPSARKIVIKFKKSQSFVNVGREAGVPWPAARFTFPYEPSRSQIRQPGLCPRLCEKAEIKNDLARQ